MFVIDENNSISWSVEAITPDEEFETLEGLQRIAEREEWTKQAVTDIWNGFIGPWSDLKPMKCFKNRPYGLRKIWDAIQRLVPGTVAVKLACQDEASATFAAVGRAARKLANAVNARLVPSDAASEPAVPKAKCPACNGSGEEDGDTCGNCFGERYLAHVADTVEDMPKKKAKAKKAPKEKRVGFIPETKPGSNLNELIKMIGRKQGASIEEVMARTGWSATHTVRGRISILKSKGVPIESFKHETRGRVYRTA